MIPRRRRAFLTMGGVCLLLLAFDGWVVLRPGQLEAQVEARLSKLLGGSVDVEALHAGLDGVLRADRLLWVPTGGQGGEQGISLRGVRLAVERLPLLVGQARIRRVEVQDGDTTVQALRSLLDRVVALPAQPRADLTAARLTVRRLTVGGLQRLLPAPIPGTARPVLLERLRVSADRDAKGVLRAAAVVARASGLSRISLDAHISLVRRRVDLEVRASNVEVRGPLADQLPGLLDRRLGALRVAGPVDLDARLGFALDGAGSVALSGTISCFNLTVQPPGLVRGITNGRGRIRVEGHTVRVEGLRGRLGDGELRLRGAIDDIRVLAGLDLELDGHYLPPGALCQIDPRPPCLDLLERVQLLGTAGVEVHFTGSATSDAGVTEEIALRFDEAAVLGGLGERVSGRVRATRSTGTGAVPPGPARLRLAEARLGGWPVRGLTAGVTVEGSRVILHDLEASVAGGRVAGQAWVEPARDPGTAAAVGLDLHAVGLELRRLLRKRIGFDPGPGIVPRLRAQVTRAAGAARPKVRLEGRVRGGDPLAWEVARPLAEALRTLGHEPGPSQEAQVVLETAGDGRWTFRAQLLCPGFALSVEGAWAAPRGLSGRVTVRAPGSHEPLATLRVSGPIDAAKLAREGRP